MRKIHRRPRCIVLVEGLRRCHRPAAKRMDDLCTCCSHDGLVIAIMSDWLSAETRRMLAYARWETARAGQRLIDAMQKRAAA